MQESWEEGPQIQSHASTYSEGVTIQGPPLQKKKNEKNKYRWSPDTLVEDPFFLNIYY